MCNNAGYYPHIMEYLDSNGYTGTCYLLHWGKHYDTILCKPKSNNLNEGSLIYSSKNVVKEEFRLPNGKFTLFQ